MRAIVIGGSGFIGRFVVEQLRARGHEVAVFHRGNGADLPPGVARIAGDRRRLADHSRALRERAPDVVVDLILGSGAQSMALMETFRGFAARVVAVSSMDVYRACGVFHGLEPGPLEPMPLTEASPLRARLHVYPIEQLRELQRVFGWLDDDYDKIPVERAVLGDPVLDGTVLRLPMVYGPGDHLHRLHGLLRQMDAGEPRIAFAAEVAHWRSPRGYVENIAAAIVLAAEADRARRRVYNVGEPESLSELEWARRVAAVAGWRGEFEVLPAALAPAHLRRPGNLAQHWVADTSRIRSELGYREPVGREQAILRSIEWERSQPPPAQ